MIYIKKNKYLLPIIFFLVVSFFPNVTFAETCVFPNGITASGYNKAQCDDAGGVLIADDFGSPIGGQVPAGGGSRCSSNVGDVGDILCKIGEIITAIIPVLIALGVVYFVWGVVQYVIGDGDEAKKKGRDKIIFGIIGLVVIAGMWGLVAIVVNTFGIDNQSADISNLTSVINNNNSEECTLESNPNLQKLLNFGTCVINYSIIPLIFTLAIAFFVWGVVQFVINTTDEEKRAKGKQFMIWGIIALAVMVSVWGLVELLGNTFNINVRFIPQVEPR